jgi:hypothetical protein
LTKGSQILGQSFSFVDGTTSVCIKSEAAVWCQDRLVRRYKLWSDSIVPLFNISSILYWYINFTWW